jgi:hypothetical protein
VFFHELISASVRSKTIHSESERFHAHWPPNRPTEGATAGALYFEAPIKAFLVRLCIFDVQCYCSIRILLLETITGIACILHCCFNSNWYRTRKRARENERERERGKRRETEIAREK